MSAILSVLMLMFAAHAGEAMFFCDINSPETALDADVETMVDLERVNARVFRYTDYNGGICPTAGVVPLGRKIHIRIVTFGRPCGASLEVRMKRGHTYRLMQKGNGFVLLDQDTGRTWQPSSTSSDHCR